MTASIHHLRNVNRPLPPPRRAPGPHTRLGRAIFELVQLWILVAHGFALCAMTLTFCAVMFAPVLGIGILLWRWLA